jgi:hypothetical protein
MSPVYTVQALAQANALTTMPPATLTDPLFEMPQTADDLNGGFDKAQLWRTFQPPLSFSDWEDDTDKCFGF